MARPTVLLAALLDCPGSARLPQVFAEAGFHVVLHAHTACGIARSQHADEMVEASEVTTAYPSSLHELLARPRFEHAVVCDNGLLFELAALRNALWVQPLLPMPATGTYPDIVVSKLNFSVVCGRAGLPVPATHIHNDPKRIAASAATLSFPHEAERMIRTGQDWQLRRWKTDLLYHKQLFRSDRPLSAATLRSLRKLQRATAGMVQDCYINVDRSTGRHAAMEIQLQALGLSGVRRLRATDGHELQHLVVDSGAAGRAGLLPFSTACDR